jgi:hypothetical protein
MDARPALEPVNAEGEPIPAPSLDALVERLAVAMAVPRPWQRVTGPAGLAYMRQQARRRLATLAGNPQARGLLVQAEEAEARRWAPTEQQGDDHV